MTKQAGKDRAPETQPKSSCGHRTLYADGMCAVCGVQPLNGVGKVNEQQSIHRIAESMDRIANALERLLEVLAR